MRDLLEGYNKNVRPTEDKELPIEVKFGIAYTQIVDLVCFYFDSMIFSEPFVALKVCSISASHLWYHVST